MKMINVPLSDHTKSVILGSLLGDGSLKLQKGYRNARFSFRHSNVQSSYFHWKVRQLKDIAAEKSVFFQTEDGGFSKNAKLRFQSRALPSLTELYTFTHTHHQFTIQRKWLNQMNALSLAIWWFDDGSLIANARKGVFCTDGFDQESVKRLAQYLRIVWGVQSHVAPITRVRHGEQKRYWRIWIRSTEELKRFLRIILPYARVPDMLSKVLLLYRDSERQQRWISEVQHKTGFSHSLIERAVEKKKERWKQFRE